LRGIEAIARDASGQIDISAQVTDPATRDRYVVSSLIEEAITSSQLEGASTTRRVAKEMIRSGRPARNRDERMILNNYAAMQQVRSLLDQPISPQLICDLHRIVTEDTLDNPDDSGRIQQPGEARVKVYDQYDNLIHEPPPASELAERMERLCSFANETESGEYVPAVVRAIAVHFTLAYDHPFADGNGRTARALFYWQMLRQGFWLIEFISISSILRAAPMQYGRSFLDTEQDDGDLTYFVLYQLRVLQRAIHDLHRYLARKAGELRETERALVGLRSDLNHRQIALIHHALRHSDARYTVVSHSTSHNIVKETARRDLLGLELRSLLRKRVLGKGFVWEPADDLSDRLSPAN
jgi:Fic family protein